MRKPSGKFMLITTELLPSKFIYAAKTRLDAEIAALLPEVACEAVTALASSEPPPSHSAPRLSGKIWEGVAPPAKRGWLSASEAWRYGPR